MNVKFAALIFALSFSTHAAAAQSESSTEPNDVPELEVEITPDKEGAGPISLSNDVANFCFFSGVPQFEFKYAIVRRLRPGKATYGTVKDILPRFAEIARRAGADAIIEYAGSQRFGFFPWRMVRPVVRGTAIKWTDPKHKNCDVVGGTTLKTILAENRAPSQ